MTYRWNDRGKSAKIGLELDVTIIIWAVWAVIVVGGLIAMAG